MIDVESMQDKIDWFKQFGKRRYEYASVEESFCGPGGDLHELWREYLRLRTVVKHIAEMKDCDICYLDGFTGHEERSGLCSKHRHPIDVANSNLG